MYPSVRAAFWKFTSDREGALDFMYCDVKNLVTTGVGNLIDPIGSALGLPWRHRSTGELATQAEIVDAWNRVKNRTDLNQRGGGFYKGVTDLYLDPAALDSLKNSRLDQNERILRSAFPTYDSMPADAQLGLHSMAWAAGPYFYKTFPSFTRAVNNGDYGTAAVQSHMQGLNADRQDANLALFQNAEEVLASGADAATLYWPNKVVKSAIAGGIGGLGTGIAIGLGFAAYKLFSRWL